MTDKSTFIAHGAVATIKDVLCLWEDNNERATRHAHAVACRLIAQGWLRGVVYGGWDAGVENTPAGPVPEDINGLIRELANSLELSRRLAVEASEHLRRQPEGLLIQIKEYPHMREWEMAERRVQELLIKIRSHAVIWPEVLR